MPGRLPSRRTCTTRHRPYHSACSPKHSTPPGHSQLSSTLIASGTKTVTSMLARTTMSTANKADGHLPHESDRERQVRLRLAHLLATSPIPPGELADNLAL